MSRLFWGFFFIFVNFNLNLNAHSLNILPPFVGYLLLLRGMRDLETESELFRGPRPFAVGMAIYTGILWLGDLLGAVSSAGWMGTLLGLAATVVSLYVAWAIIQGVQDMESRRNTDLGASGMRRAWIVAGSGAGRELWNAVPASGSGTGGRSCGACGCHHAAGGLLAGQEAV